MDDDQLRALETAYSQGDLNALEALLTHHDKMLTATAHRYAGGSVEIAEEALAELRLQLVKAWNTFEPATARWMTWVDACLRTRVIDVLRKLPTTYCLTRSALRQVKDLQVTSGNPSGELVKLSNPVLENLERLIGVVFETRGKMETQLKKLMSSVEFKRFRRHILGFARMEHNPARDQPDPATSNDSVLNNAAQSELTERIRACLNRLRKDDRELIRLKHLVGLNQVQIAQALGQDKSWVSRHLKAAMAKLAKILRDDGFEFDDFEE